MNEIATPVIFLLMSTFTLPDAKHEGWMIERVANTKAECERLAPRPDENIKWRCVEYRRVDK